MAQLDTEKAQIVGVCHCHKSYLEPLRLLQAAADTPLRPLEVKSCLDCNNSTRFWSVKSDLFEKDKVINRNLF
jgi:hypothetical protein